jgi:hypothetical protein
MTETLQSPDNHLMGLKRRKSNFCDGDDVDNFSTARFGLVSKRSRQSSSRFEESENMRPCTSGSNMYQSTFFEENDRSKRGRMGEGDVFESSSSNRSTHSFQDQIEQLQKYHESQTLSIKTEFQMNLDKAQRELECLRSQNKSMVDSNQSMCGEHKRIMDENKVLKRAVAIQDNRYNEQHQQNQQYQQVLSQATEYVQGLQEVNKQLEAKLLQTLQQLSEAMSSSSHRGSHHHNYYDQEQPPPDVY